MNEPRLHPSAIDAEELNRLHDRAHALAPRLRAEAIDDFWRAVAALWIRRDRTTRGVAVVNVAGC
jgi:hypothetical protein